MSAIIPNVQCDLCPKTIPVTECGQMHLRLIRSWVLVPALDENGQPMMRNGSKVLVPQNAVEYGDFCPDCFQIVLSYLENAKEKLQEVKKNAITPASSG